MIDLKQNIQNQDNINNWRTNFSPAQLINGDKDELHTKTESILIEFLLFSVTMNDRIDRLKCHVTSNCTIA